MALRILIQYQEQPVTYEVTQQEEDVYHLRLSDDCCDPSGPYIPQKFYIRRKGKIWISDLEDYRELVGCLTAEIESFHFNNSIRA